MPAAVSVIIPTYNYGHYIGRAIEGALAQQVAGGVEVVVVDDGSTDDTPAVVARFGSRVQYLRQQNRREGAARNYGVSHASGEYLAFLDPDDYFLPGKLAADVTRFERSDGPALVYSRALNVDASDRVIGGRRLPSPEGDIFRALARENFLPMSTVAVRADAFRAVGGFVEDPALSGTADWELWLRLAARWPVGFAEQTATRIRVHQRNMSSDPSYMERAMLAGVRHALLDGEVARRLGGSTGPGARWLRAHMLVTIALNAYGNGRRGRSARRLWQALATWPPVAMDPRFLGAAGRALLGRRSVRVLRAVSPSPL